MFILFMDRYIYLICIKLTPSQKLKGRTQTFVTDILNNLKFDFRTYLTMELKTLKVKTKTF